MDRKDKDTMRRRLCDINQQGFSLLEAVIALSILAIGLLALAGLQVVVTRGNTGSRNLTSAVMLAESEMEQLKASGFSALLAGSDAPSVANVTFTRSWTITTPYSGSSTMKLITVTVTWSDRTGSSRSVPLYYVMSSSVN